MSFLKKSFSVLPAMALVACFVACDSDSTSASNDEDVSSSSNEAGESSSSVIPSSSSAVIANSSSNVVPSSSSAVTPSNVEGSSSSVASSSSSKYVVEYGRMTDARDGQTYATVTIRTQTWMVTNLNYADSVKTPSLKGKSWCYDDDPEKCGATGRLYSWAAAIDSVDLADHGYMCGDYVTCDRLSADTLAANPIQGVCPSGWHLPSYDEWKTLRFATGGVHAGKALKSTSDWYRQGNGTDAYGFSAEPAGYSDGIGHFDSAGKSATFWSASPREDNSGFAYTIFLNYNNEDAYLYYDSKSDGYSVRCIKD